MATSTAASPSSAISLVPLYDTSTFWGRFLHFATITDWRLCIVTEEKLQQARTRLLEHKGDITSTSSKDLVQASALYQSAFHPETGDLQNIVGRMSFQVPGGMLLTGAMLAFYKSTPAVVFWQWANQSFNALVNYTNRSASSELSTQQLGLAYSTATSAALLTALGLKRLLAGAKRFAVLQRFVPFVAVAAANMVNIPLMRQNELSGGVAVVDDQGHSAGMSKVCAVKGISEVVFSRIVMAAPGMVALPLLMQRVETQRWYRPGMNLPLQTVLCGVSLTAMVPLACALFDQKCAMSVPSLEKAEPALYSQLQRQYGPNMPRTLYFNKGL